MTNPPDHYAVLHIPRDSSQQQIARAYRALMRSHHPDMEGGRAPAGKDGTGAGPPALPESELLRIMEAFAVLRDPVRRAAYDRESRGPVVRGAVVPEGKRDRAPGPRNIPVRKVQTHAGDGQTIRVTPVRWESGPWA